MELPVRRPFGCDKARPSIRQDILSLKPDLSPGADLITLADRQPHEFPGRGLPPATTQTRADAAAEFGYSYE